MSIGEKLRILRLKTRRTLKEQSEIFGVSLNTVYRWEHNLVVPKRSVLKKMASYYDVPIEWLLQEGSEDDKIEMNGYTHTDDTCEQQLLRMFRKLTTISKYKILGYVERIYLESMDENTMA